MKSSKNKIRLGGAVILLTVLNACQTVPVQKSAASATAVRLPPTTTIVEPEFSSSAIIPANTKPTANVTTIPNVQRPGGYYQDDGPPDSFPMAQQQVISNIPHEPLASRANQPYFVLGGSYVPDTTRRTFSEEGMGSWYGKKFHGRKTANGETYDMHAMTAAHRTLALPSYVRVTNLSNNRSVVVRVNDRGPFHSNRIIDLSYAAADALGYVAKGSTKVRVESIVPGEVLDQPSATVVVTPIAAPVMPVASSYPLDLAQSATADTGAAQSPTVVSPVPDKGVFLQYGVFASSENASRFSADISNRLIGNGAGVKISRINNYFKVLSGPYPSVSAAYEFGNSNARLLGFRPLVITY